MSNSGRATDFYLNGLGSLGTVFSTSLAMGCCAGFLAPLASAAALIFPFVNPSLQMPLLYTTLALTFIGLMLSYRRQRLGFYLVSGLLGAVFLLIPFHTALEVSLFYLFIGMGLAALLIASWVPLIGRQPQDERRFVR